MQEPPSDAFSGVLPPSGTLPGVSLPPASLSLSEPVLGFDPSTLRISLCVLHAERDRDAHGVFRCSTLSLPRVEGPRRFAEAHPALLEWLIDQRADHPEMRDAGAAYVEQPFAKARHIHPSSYFILGVLLVVLGQPLEPKTKLELIEPPTWKARALGKGYGNSKPPVYFEWARSVGYTGKIEDEAAALGVATGGAILRGES